jgi:tripartite-type tricarboxylate transporter receptor subunit TctC
MKLFARHFAAALGLASLMLTASAQAQSTDWPTKPVRFLLPAAAGTAPDIMARLLGEKLAKLWGQPVIVDDRPGAGGLIGLTAVKTGEKDDHVFVFAPASVLTLTPYMYKSNRVDVVRDFAPVALVGISPMMLAASATSPANSLADLLAIARRQPDQFVVATTFPYSVPHLAADMLSRATGVPMRAVPFSTSGQSITAVVNGDAQMLIDGVPPIDPMVKGGRLKAIAIFSDGRVANRPQLPAVSETYPSMVINGWFGVVALNGTSDKAIERVNRDLGTVLAAPDVIERLDSLGVYPKTMSPTQFGTYWREELVRWEKVLRDVGAQQTTQP